MKKCIVSMLMGLILSTFIGTAYGITVNYETSSIGGDYWKYIYTVSNDTFQFAINEITFTYPVGYGFSDLQALTKPNWQTNAVDPTVNGSVGNPTDGFYIAVADSGKGIATGTSEGGFILTFYWPNPPDYPPTDLSLPVDVISSAGETWSGYTTPIPEPATLLLVGVGLLGVAVFRKRLVK